MTVSQNGINFTKRFEGCRLSAYADIGGKFTIGYGITVYKNGTPVKAGDRITQIEADMELVYQLNLRSDAVNHLIGAEVLTQNQFDSLTDFCFNEGVEALASSTLLKRVLTNPHDPLIKNSFLSWVYVHVEGELREVQGLKVRRQAEAVLYYSQD